MVLWEITLATAYFLGLRRTYRLALQIQRRFLKNRPATRAFANRRTQAAFRLALRVVTKIQQRDLSLGRFWGNAILRFLDRMKPSAQMHLPGPQDPHQSAPASREGLPARSPVTRVLNSAQKGYLKEVKLREDAAAAAEGDQEQSVDSKGEGEQGAKSRLESQNMSSQGPLSARDKQGVTESVSHASQVPGSFQGGSSKGKSQLRSFHTSSGLPERSGVDVQRPELVRNLVCGALEFRREAHGVFGASRAIGNVFSRPDSIGCLPSSSTSPNMWRWKCGARMKNWRTGCLRPDIAELMHGM